MCSWTGIEAAQYGERSLSLPFDGYPEQNRPQSKRHRCLARASPMDGDRQASISTVGDNSEHLVLWIPAGSYGHQRPLEMERHRCVPRGIDRHGRGAPATGREIHAPRGPSVRKTVRVDRLRRLPRAPWAPEQKLGVPAGNERFWGLSTGFDVDRCAVGQASRRLNMGSARCRSPSMAAPSKIGPRAKGTGAWRERALWTATGRRRSRQPAITLST